MSDVKAGEWRLSRMEQRVVALAVAFSEAKAVCHFMPSTDRAAKRAELEQRLDVAVAELNAERGIARMR